MNRAYCVKHYKETGSFKFLINNPFWVKLAKQLTNLKDTHELHKPKHSYLSYSVLELMFNVILETGLSENLHKLNLENNGLNKLPRHITLFENLRKIYIAGNNITSLPKGFSKLEKLSYMRYDVERFEQKYRDKIRLLLDANHLNSKRKQ